MARKKKTKEEKAPVLGKVTYVEPPELKSSPSQEPTPEIGDTLEIEVVKKYCEPIIAEIGSELAQINEKIEKQIAKLKELTTKYDLNIQMSNTHNTELDLHTTIVFDTSPEALYDKFKVTAIQDFLKSRYDNQEDDD